MNTQTRKQRELLQRKALWLDIAEQLIIEGGHQALSMDRIAELSEYSKGTVYQTFPCKEEVLIAMCLRSMGTLTELFERANGFNGRPRERITAIGLAHVLYAKLHSLQFCMIQTIKSGGVKEKISAASRQQHLEAEQRIIGTVMKPILDGIAAGDLVLPSGLTPVDIVFGLWSSSYGSLVLQTYDIDFDEIGLPNPNASMGQMFQFALDGMGWQPLSQNNRYARLIERIQREVFPVEFDSLAQQSPNKTVGQGAANAPPTE